MGSSSNLRPVFPLVMSALRLLASPVFGLMVSSIVRSGTTPSVASSFACFSLSSSSFPPNPWYAIVESANRSPMIVMPCLSFGSTRSFIICARAAMNSSASAAGTFLLFGDLMILRIFSPSGVDPGSLTSSVLCPSFSKRCSSSLA